MKFCKDCTHFGHIYRGIARVQRYGCLRPLSDDRSPVTGKFLDTVDDYAWTEREPSKKGKRERCGPDAQFFEEAYCSMEISDG